MSDSGVVETKTVLRACPICNERIAKVVHHQKFVLSENHPLKAGYDVVCCETCGFCYADTRASQHDYDEFYRNLSKYTDNATSTGGGSQPWDGQRLCDMAADISKFAPERDARIADIGCANGGFLRKMQELGYSNLCGIDPSPACIAQTRSISGIEAYTGFLSDMPSEAGPLNGVVLSHVMEHIRDLVPVLNSLRESMRPESWLYVETPDASRYGEFLFAPFQDFNTEHINHFSSRCLANVLRCAGFEPLQDGSKTIYSAPEMPYPAIYTFARKRSAPLPIEKDAQLQSLLLSYISASKRMLQEMDRRIHDFLQRDRRVIVWGTGQLMMKLLSDTCLSVAEIQTFIDGNPSNQHKLILGKRVIAPAKLNDEATPILVASTINQNSIVETIHKFNLRNPILTLRP